MLAGVDGHLVNIEAGLAGGLPGMQVVGLAGGDIRDTRDRVRAAVANSGELWPPARITLTVRPAGPSKPGSILDVATAVAVLAAAGSVPAAGLERVVLLGELGLAGRLRPVPGILPAVLAAVRGGVRQVLVPAANTGEAMLVPGAQVRGADSLADVLAFLRSGSAPPAPPKLATPEPAPAEREEPDMADLAESAAGRRALEVAAAGGHHLFLLGPTGTGKTMLAERLPGILPPLDDDDALQVSLIHSAAGLLAGPGPLLRRPPYQAPHHTSSIAAMFGGGGHSAPGAVSLAHHGVLFLEEAPEFPHGVLAYLLQPLQVGEILIARGGATTRYPARFQLVLAAAPCPCAPLSGADCACTPNARRRYRARLTGPLLDRIDLHATLQPPTSTSGRPGETTAVVAARVAQARAAAAHRLAGTGWRTNAEIPSPALADRWPLPSSVTAAADRALQTGWLSTRGRAGALRLAWTIADLAGRTSPTAADMAEAVDLRRPSISS
jgi:magnesium chelatase family protein